MKKHNTWYSIHPCTLKHKHLNNKFLLIFQEKKGRFYTGNTKRNGTMLLGRRVRGCSHRFLLIYACTMILNRILYQKMHTSWWKKEKQGRFVAECIVAIPFFMCVLSHDVYTLSPYHRKSKTNTIVHFWSNQIKTQFIMLFGHNKHLVNTHAPTIK